MPWPASNEAAVSPVGPAPTMSTGTLVVTLPGSTGGVRDGVAVLGPVLHHALDQLRGGDH